MRSFCRAKQARAHSRSQTPKPETHNQGGTCPLITFSLQVDPSKTLERSKFMRPDEKEAPGATEMFVALWQVKHQPLIRPYVGLRLVRTSALHQTPSSSVAPTKTRPSSCPDEKEAPGATEIFVALWQVKT